MWVFGEQKTREPHYYYMSRVAVSKRQLFGESVIQNQDTAALSPHSYHNEGIYNGY